MRVFVAGRARTDLESVVSASALSDGLARTEKARETHVTRAAHRAVDDPAQLARAARIVRAALARKRLTLDELTPLPNSTSGLPEAS
jgi:hypothetical protein